jgi:hypothetical protein
MKSLSTALLSASVVLASTTLVSVTHAADITMKAAPTDKKELSIDCEKHMALSKKHVGPKDDTMKMHDKQCAELMKKEGALDRSLMKREPSPADPMAK